MKTAWLILSCLSIVCGIKVENFESLGVYFQSLGTAKLNNEQLRYSNVVDLEAMDSALKYLRADYDAFRSLNPLHGVEQSNDVQKMINDIESIKVGSPTGSHYSESKELTNMINEVHKFENFCEAARKKLRKNLLPQANLVKAIKDQFNTIMKIVRLNEFDEKMLSLYTFKKDLKNIGKGDQAKSLYSNLSEISTVTQSTIQRNKVHVFLTINLADDEVFDLWKVISLPIIKESNVVSLRNEYTLLLTSNDKVLASTTNVASNMYNKGFRYLSKSHNFNNLKSDSCLAGLFKGDSNSIDSCHYSTSFANVEIFQDLGSYRYLFAIRDETEYTFTCPGMNHNIGRTNYIQGTGILTLNEGCSFKTKSNEFKAVKVDVTVDHKDKFEFNDVFNRLMRILKTNVLKKPPIFLPSDKITIEFEKFNKNLMELEQNQKEAQGILDTIKNRTPPTFQHSFYS